MSEKFIIRSKNTKYKDDSYLVTTVRLPQTIRDEFEKLAVKSGHSRNELMCMALQYALDNLKFLPEDKKEE